MKQGRQPMPSKTPFQRVVHFLHTIEDFIMITLLLAMIMMAVLQIFLRNLFSTGIFWGDGLVRVLVLWIGLMGGMIASRSDNHISIDVISRYLPIRIKRISNLIVNAFTMIICGIMAYYSYLFVLDEKQSQMVAFAKVPAWICESIIPFAFMVISIRYLILIVENLIQFKAPPVK